MIGDHITESEMYEVRMKKYQRLADLEAYIVAMQLTRAVEEWIAGTWAERRAREELADNRFRDEDRMRIWGHDGYRDRP